MSTLSGFAEPSSVGQFLFPGYLSVPISEDTIVRTLMSQRAALLAYIWAIVRDGELVEDVFQEVSLLAVREREKLRDEAALATWLRRTARFKALSALRDRGRSAVLLSDDVLDQLDGQWEQQHQASTAEEYQAALRHCLKQLTPNARQIVSLRYMQGLKGTEVAEKLGRKTTSVYQALSRIHNTLRACLCGQLNLPEAGDD